MRGRLWGPQANCCDERPDRRPHLRADLRDSVGVPARGAPLGSLLASGRELRAQQALLHRRFRGLSVVPPVQSPAPDLFLEHRVVGRHDFGGVWTVQPFHTSLEVIKEHASIRRCARVPALRRLSPSDRSPWRVRQ